jgi:tyrosyl-tRNA synthetase
MSKSKNNYIAITEPANTMFAKIMSISDEMMWKYYDLLSFCSIEQIAAFRKAVADGQNPRDIKVALAQEIVARFHDQAAAEDALPISLTVPKAVFRTISPKSLSGAPAGIGHLLKQANLCASTSEANRMIEQGGVRIDGTVLSDKGLKLEAGTFVLQVGKRKFARVTLTA